MAIRKWVGFHEDRGIVCIRRSKRDVLKRLAQISLDLRPRERHIREGVYYYTAPKIGEVVHRYLILRADKLLELKNTGEWEEGFWDSVEFP